MQSRNNNIFAYSNYWQAWSRILFHDHGGRGMEGMRRRYEIPKHIKTIEVDLTGINGTHWDKVAQINIRCHHCSNFGQLRGTLPDDVVEQMKLCLSEPVIDAVVHVDLLKFIDYNKFDLWNNGGAPLELIVRDFETLDHYWQERRYYGGGPGLLRSDVEPDWVKAKTAWEAEVKKVLSRA